MSLQRERPILFCFCGPTASGKSTISRRLVKSINTLGLSISTTTRAPRPGEQDGVEYFFVSNDEFEARVKAGRFIEHANFNEKRYGTEFTNIENAAKRGDDLLLDIEVQGVQILKQKYPGDVVTVFVFPPTFMALEARVRARGAENEQQIAQRLTIARKEIEILRDPKFSDFLLINDELDRAVLEATSIITSERQRLSRFETSGLSKLLK